MSNDLYAKVFDGEILEYRADPPAGNQATMAASKPRWLPVTDTNPDFDPVSEVKEGPEVTVGPTSVARVWTVRDKNADEIAAMIADKDAAYEAEFQRRCDLPIAYQISGTAYTWHADAEGRENVMGIVTAIAAGLDVPDPRPFTPEGDGGPLMLSHDDFKWIGQAMMDRKDALFVRKKTMQAALAAMTDPAEIDALDVTQGW